MHSTAPAPDSSSSGDRPQDSRYHDRKPIMSQHPPRTSSPMSHTALPPIHQLQLPPSTSTSAGLHPTPHTVDHPSHVYHRQPQHLMYPSTSSLPQHAYQDRDERRHPERPLAPVAYGASSIPEQSGSAGAESDQDEIPVDVQGPPKKKRRRQALSCTECKRRKIKCDRANPCGPCQRRSEPDKCHWHVVEPIEKYVTRDEWNDLKTKFHNLEEYCKQLTSFMCHFHPELASQMLPEHQSSSGLPTLPSLAALRSGARAYNLSGPGVSGFQRAPSTQPLGVSTSTSSAHSLPPLDPTLPPPVATALPHAATSPTQSRLSPVSPRTLHPQHSDRRTSASGVREQLSERLRHQVAPTVASVVQSSYTPFQTPRSPIPLDPSRSPSSSTRFTPGSPSQRHHQPHHFPSDASEGRYRALPPSSPQVGPQRQQLIRRNPLSLSSIVGSERALSPPTPHLPPRDTTVTSPRVAPYQVPPRRTASPVVQPKKDQAQTSDRVGDALRRLSPSLPYSSCGETTRILPRNISPRLRTMEISDSCEPQSRPRTAEVQFTDSRSGTSTPPICTTTGGRLCRTSLHLGVTPSNPTTPPPFLAIH